MTWRAEIPTRLFHQIPVRHRADILAVDQEILVWEDRDRAVVVYEGSGDRPPPELVAHEVGL